MVEGRSVRYFDDATSTCVEETTIRAGVDRGQAAGGPAAGPDQPDPADMQRWVNIGLKVAGLKMTAAGLMSDDIVAFHRPIPDVVDEKGKPVESPSAALKDVDPSSPQFHNPEKPPKNLATREDALRAYGFYGKAR